MIFQEKSQKYPYPFMIFMTFVIFSSLNFHDFPWISKKYHLNVYGVRTINYPKHKNRIIYLDFLEVMGIGRPCLLLLRSGVGCLVVTVDLIRRVGRRRGGDGIVGGDDFVLQFPSLPRHCRRRGGGFHGQNPNPRLLAQREKERWGFTILLLCVKRYE